MKSNIFIAAVVKTGVRVILSCLGGALVIIIIISMVRMEEQLRQ